MSKSNREIMSEYRKYADSNKVLINAIRIEEKWLATRRQIVMASDTPVLWGMSTTSPYTLFCKKVNGVDDEDWKERMKEVFYWGHALESLIAERFNAMHRERIICDPGPYTIQQHKSYQYMGATIDRMQCNADGVWGVLELKSRNTWAGQEFSERVPDDVLLQLHHQMICTGTTWGSVACLIGGNKFVCEDIRRNETVCDMIINKAREFSVLMSCGTPPPVDNSDSTRRTLQLLHPDDNGETVHLDATYDELDAQYLKACEDEKDAQARKKEAQNRIISAIGNSTFGVGSSYGYSYKTQERGISLKIDPANETELIKARIPYEITGGTKIRVLRRSKFEPVTNE